MSSPIGRLAARVTPTKRRRLLLGCLAAAVLVYELDSVADDDSVVGDSISETFRAIFRTDTVAGRIAWTVAFAAFDEWFGPHIGRKVAAVVTN